jgi:hypothetical protein
MLRALIRGSRFILQPGNEKAVGASIQEWLRMPAQEGIAALKDVTFAYTDGVPRNEKSFWDVVARRARLLSSKVAVSEVADFSMVKEARSK